MIQRPIMINEIVRITHLNEKTRHIRHDVTHNVIIHETVAPNDIIIDYDSSFQSDSQLCCLLLIMC